MPQTITVLRTLGPALAKTWRADGTIKSYDEAKQYRVREHRVNDLPELHQLVGKIAKDPRRAMVRGRHRGAIPDAPVMRNLSTFDDEPSHLFTVDVDNFTPLDCDPVDDPLTAIREFVRTLPECLRDAGYVWQLSGSFGHPSKAQQLRAHLYFYLHEPLTCAQAEAWSKKYLPHADRTVHRTVQLNYTSAPVMEEGLVDPVAVRLGYHEGALGDAVVIPSDMPVPDVSEANHVQREGRANMADPRDKPGLVGAVCRAFTPAQVVDLFPELFATGSTDVRLTWLAGGGATDGLRITDNGTHLYNSHATAPVARAVNVFDFVRHHVFGHLDEGIEQDVLDLDVAASPSHKATVEWATAQPEVQAETSGPKAEAAQEAAADSKAEEALSSEEERGRRLNNLRGLVLRTATLDQLEHKTAHQIRKGIESFGDTERELIVHALKDRAAALGAKLSIALVRKWVKPMGELSGTFPHVTSTGAPKCTIENVQALCAQIGLTIRYDVIHKSIVFAGDLFDGFIGADAEGSAFFKLVSECQRVDMPVNTSVLAGYVLTIADENPYNPVTEWVSSRAWDGVSRLQAFYDTVTEDPTFKKADKELIMRKWSIQAIAAAYSPVPLQLRGMITLQGAQYIGKGQWAASLCPLPDCVRLDLHLEPHNKDNVKIAVSCWIAEISELEGTFNRAEQASLKGFGSKKVDIMRRPYAKGESHFQRRTVFIASVNQTEFLVDDSGSTRNWVIPVIGINFQHGIDMQQLWAECLVLWNAGEKHWFDKDEMALVVASADRFQVVEPLRDRVIRAYEQALADPANTLLKEMTSTEASDHFNERAKNKSEACTVGKALAACGAVKGSGQRGWMIPVAPGPSDEMPD